MKKILAIVFALLMVGLSANAIKMKDLKVYINPGHGGYTSNDRPIGIYPYAASDTNGYWESKSNLYKGLYMYHILDSIGTKAYLSRTKNDSEDTDRDLYDIAYEANDLGCDVFFSIHSNAGENVNYPLTLYREDAVGTPRYPDAVNLSNLLWDNLHSSKLSLWTRDTRYVSGDLTFYPQWGNQGLGVLRRLYVLGLLSEGGMHEHRPEAHRLMNQDFCWLEAWHFVKTIMEAFNTEDRFVTGNVAGVIYDNHNTREQTLNFQYYTAYGRDRNKPLNGVLVELIDKTGAVIQTRKTDKDNNGVFVFRNVTPGTYKVKASIDGYYDYEYDATVVANDVTYKDLPMVMKREMPLEIVSYTPAPAAGELVSCVEPLVFNFNTDVNEESFKNAFKIEPAVAGEWTFSNSYKTATFRPTVAYNLLTHYKVTVATTATSPDTYYPQANLQKEFVLEFDTKGRNKLELIQAYPIDGDQVHYKTPVIEFRFDKTLDKTNIYDNIQVLDKNGVALSMNKRSCAFNKLSNGYGNAQMVLASDLKIGDSYKVVLTGDIKDTEGVPFTTGVQYNFTAVDQGEIHDGTLIEPFETEGIFVYDTENSIGNSTDPQYFASVAKYLFDAKSGRFVYNFADQKGGIATWKYTGAYHVAKKGDKVGLYVFGDMNNHELSLGFTSGTDTKYIKVCDTDFFGWRYFDVKLDALLDDFEYLFSKVRLTQKEAPYAQNGAIHLDNLLYSGSASGVNDVIEDSDFKVVVSEGKLEVKTTNEISSMNLFNASGMLVQQSNSKVMNVKDLVPGVYILDVAAGNSKKSVSIVIK